MLALSKSEWPLAHELLAFLSDSSTHTFNNERLLYSLLNLNDATRPLVKDVALYLELWKAFDDDSSVAFPFPAADPNYCYASQAWHGGFQLLLGHLRRRSPDVPFDEFLPASLKDISREERAALLDDFVGRLTDTLDDDEFLGDLSEGDLQRCAHPMGDLDGLLKTLGQEALAERERFASDVAAWLELYEGGRDADVLESEAQRILGPMAVKAAGLTRSRARSGSRPRRSAPTSSSASSSVGAGLAGARRKAKSRIFTPLMLFLAVLLPLLLDGTASLGDALNAAKNVAGVVLGAATVYAALPFSTPLAPAVISSGVVLLSNSLYTLHSGLDRDDQDPNRLESKREEGVLGRLVRTLTRSASYDATLSTTVPLAPKEAKLSEDELTKVRGDIARLRARAEGPDAQPLLRLLRDNALFPELPDSGYERRTADFLKRSTPDFLSTSVYTSLSRKMSVLADRDLVLLVEGMEERAGAFTRLLASLPDESLAQTLRKNWLYSLRQMSAMQGFELGGVLGEGGAMAQKLVRYLDRATASSGLVSSRAKGPRAGDQALTAREMASLVDRAYEQHIDVPDAYNRTLLYSQAAFGLVGESKEFDGTLDRDTEWFAAYADAVQSDLDAFRETLSYTDALELERTYGKQWAAKKNEARRTVFLRLFERGLGRADKGAPLDLGLSPNAKALMGECLKTVWQSTFAQHTADLRLDDTFAVTPAALELLEFYAFRSLGDPQSQFASSVYPGESSRDASEQRVLLKQRMDKRMQQWHDATSALDKAKGHLTLREAGDLAALLNDVGAHTVDSYARVWESKESLDRYLLTLRYLAPQNLLDVFWQRGEGPYEGHTLRPAYVPLVLGLPPMLGEAVFQYFNRDGRDYLDERAEAKAFRRALKRHKYASYAAYKDDYLQGKKEAAAYVLQMTEPALLLGLQKEARLAGVFKTVAQRALTMAQESKGADASRLIEAAKSSRTHAQSREAAIDYTILRLLSSLSGRLISSSLFVLFTLAFHKIYHERLDAGAFVEGREGRAVEGRLLPLPLARMLQAAARKIPLYDRAGETEEDASLRNSATVAAVALNLALMGSAVFYGSYSIVGVAADAAATLGTTPYGSLFSALYSGASLFSLPQGVLAAFSSLPSNAALAAGALTAGLGVATKVSRLRKRHGGDEESLSAFSLYLAAGVDLAEKTGRWIFVDVLDSVVQVLFTPYYSYVASSLLEAKNFQTVQVSVMYSPPVNNAWQPYRRIGSPEGRPWAINPWLFGVFTSAPAVQGFATLFGSWLSHYVSADVAHLLPFWLLCTSSSLQSLVKLLGGEKTLGSFYQLLGSINALGRRALALSSFFAFEKTRSLLLTLYDSSSLHLGILSVCTRMTFLLDAYRVTLENALVLRRLLAHSDALSSEDVQESVEKEASRLTGRWAVVVKALLGEGSRALARAHDRLPEQLKWRSIALSFWLKMRSTQVEQGRMLAPLNSTKRHYDEAEKVVGRSSAQAPTPGETLLGKKAKADLLPPVFLKAQPEPPRRLRPRTVQF